MCNSTDGTAIPVLLGGAKIPGTQETMALNGLAAVKSGPSISVVSLFKKGDINGAVH